MTLSSSTSSITSNEIIGRWASERIAEKIIEKISRQHLNDYWEDLAQDTYLTLMSKDDSVIQNLYRTNTQNFYIARMLMTNIASNRSLFHTKYRKPRRWTTETVPEPKSI